MASEEPAAGGCHGDGAGKPPRRCGEEPAWDTPEAEVGVLGSFSHVSEAGIP